MRIIIFFFMIPFLLFFISCAPYDYGEGYNNNYTDEYQSIKLEAVDNGLAPVAGKVPKKSLRKIDISYVGQSEIIKVGEKVELFLNIWDLDDICLITKTNQDNDEVILEVVDRDYAIVKLDKKCDVVELRGIDVLPQIEIAPGLNPEQIVITPLFDDACTKIGYQFRYGSTGRGCYKEGKEVLKRFNNCVGRKGNSSRKKIPRCLESAWFGVPCP